MDCLLSIVNLCSEDMFGANDEDWAIYRKIVCCPYISSSTHSHFPIQNTAALSSDEEDDIQQLRVIEGKLLVHDPTFTTEDTHASRTAARSALLSSFRPQYPPGDAAGAARIHLNAERWRVCETYFAPSMAGIDAAGIGEVLQTVLARFPQDEKARLVKVRAFVTLYHQGFHCC